MRLFSSTTDKRMRSTGTTRDRPGIGIPWKRRGTGKKFSAISAFNCLRVDHFRAIRTDFRLGNDSKLCSAFQTTHYLLKKIFFHMKDLMAVRTRDLHQRNAFPNFRGHECWHGSARFSREYTGFSRRNNILFAFPDRNLQIFTLILPNHTVQTFRPDKRDNKTSRYYHKKTK